MAVHKVTNNDEYLAVASDAKPTVLGTGAKLMETDTGKRWIHNGTTWVENLDLQYAMNESDLAKAP